MLRFLLMERLLNARKKEELLILEFQDQRLCIRLIDILIYNNDA